MPVATSTLAVLAAGSTAINYMGSRQAANQALLQGKYESKLLETEAGYSDQQAKDALAIGAETESRHRAAVRQLIGSQRTSFAAQGVALNKGSALDVQLESASMGEVDATTIRNNARRQAWGFTVQASDLRNRARLARAGAQGMAQGYRNQGYTTVLSGAADLGNIYRMTK